MDETTQTTEAEATPEATPKVQAPIINPILSEAKTLADRIDAGNAKMQQLISKQEQLAAEIALGGRSLAGNQAAPKTDEQKLKEEVAKFIADE